MKQLKLFYYYKIYYFKQLGWNKQIGLLTQKSTNLCMYKIFL